MKQLIAIIALPMLLFYGCSHGQSGETVLTPNDFKEQIVATEGAVVLDVRTPGEFAKGHVEGAVNADWNGSDFDARLQKMDKSSTYFVYCLSGGRSSAAAAHMRSEGFTDVREMEGGMLAWREAQLPETTGSKQQAGAEMTMAQFQQTVTSEKTVLVDFYAEWCGPCKKMEPALNTLAKEQEATLKVVRIDVDKNPQLATQLGITALPTLHVYKGGKQTWQHVGYLDNNQLTEAVKK